MDTMTPDERTKRIVAIRHRVETARDPLQTINLKTALEDREWLLSEVDRLRALWPTNGLDHDTDVRQLIANHRAWTDAANGEAARLRAELDALSG